ncbi:MAG: hybrid sensor histidine kinase/response regulator [Alphaproteobacteria bacterium]|nr:hybrid sensor histidine kinase/response regulator [Alphaproteobacteria bacterium]
MGRLADFISQHGAGANQAGGPDQADLTPDVGTTPTKILVVDDEPQIIEEVVECLEDENLECLSATSAVAAFAALESDHDIGIIVTDIRMPQMDGLEMVQEMQNRYGSSRDMVVIVVTGHAGMAEAIESLRLGADDFLTKPISPEHLLHSVHRATEMIKMRSVERFFQARLKREVKKKTAEVHHLASELEIRNRDLETKNEELAVLNNLKGNFLNMISHELNTPLHAIRGFAELLKIEAQESGEKEAEEMADHILLSGNRLKENVENILTLAEISGGTLPLTYSRFSAQDFIDTVIAEYGPAVEQFQASLWHAYPQQPISIDGDFQKLQAAVWHLIGNAAKFSSAEGVITLAVRQEEDRVCVSVSDNGPGIPVGHIQSALEPLRQLDGSRRRKVEGMGLGLPIAKGIAELHGGRIEINSTPGRGSCVEIILPLRSE